MRIQHIQAANLKGASFSHDLSPVTVFTGENFSGKSSRLQAIYLALFGQVPSPNIKDTPRDVFLSLASDQTMSVRAELREPNLTITRDWKQEGNTVSYVHSPGIPVFPEVMLNTRHYLGMSDAKRTEYVFALLNLQGKPDAEEKIRNAIEALPGEGQFADAKKELLAHIPPLTTGSVGAWIEFVVGTIKEKRDVAVAVSKRMTETVRGVTQLTATQKQVRPIADVKRERREVETKVNESREKAEEIVTKITQYQTAMTRMQANRDSLKEKGAALTAELEDAKKQITKVLRIKVCPTCGASVKGTAWREREEKRWVKQVGLVKQDVDKLAVQQQENHKRIAAQAKLIAEQRKLHAKQVAVTDELTARYEALSAEMMEASARAQDVGREQQALDVRLSSDAMVQIAREALKAVQEIQRTIVARAFDHFIAIANRLTHEILPTPLIFQDGIIGRMRNGRFFRHSSFTTAEEIVAFAGICMALCAQSPLKILVIDDLSLIDEANLNQFFVNVLGAVQDKLIDQFIGAHVSGWNFGAGVEQVAL